MALASLELLRSDYVVISLEYDGRIVRFRRLGTTFPNLAVAREVYEQVLATYDRLGRRGRGLLVDSREAFGRNDPEFEAVFLEFRSKAVTGFAGHRVLMRTAVGMLQAQRFDGGPMAKLVTDTEAEAIASLLNLVTRAAG